MGRPIRFARAFKRPRAAFTLIEMAVVLVIVGLVTSSLLPALKAQREAAQRSLTLTRMDSALRAIAAFTQAHGCLPCPAPARTLAADFGFVRGQAAGPPCGTCAGAEGIMPYVSLGLSPADAKDGWGRWLTMRIDPDLAINFGVVPPTQPCTASDPAPCALGASQKGLCRAGLLAGKQVQVRAPAGPSSSVQPAALLLLSHGANGFGAYRTSVNLPASSAAHPAYNGLAPACSTQGGFERCNADGDAVFVAADPVFGPHSDYDDIVLYKGRNALISLLGSGACQTAWEAAP